MALAAKTGATTVDQPFDVDTLYQVRQAVLAHAGEAGLPGHRASDAVLAVHELAANAVRYGGGTGRLRIWVTSGTLCFQVQDSGPASRDGQSAATPARRPDGTPDSPYQPGHGLWLARAVADEMSAETGPGGSQVTVTFTLPLRST